MRTVACDSAPTNTDFRNIISPFFPTHSISLNIRQGEILGLAGLVGAGRSELAMTVFGITRQPGGEIFIDGKAVQVHSPRDASRTAEEQRKKLSIRTTSCETLAKNLSGGNQQKLVLAKRLSLSPKLAVAPVHANEDLPKSDHSTHQEIGT